MSIEFHCHANLYLMGENATHSIARFSGRLAALLFVALKDSDPLRAKARVESYAGKGHAPHRALPDNPKTAHSNASNRGIKVKIRLRSLTIA